MRDDRPADARRPAGSRSGRRAREGRLAGRIAADEVVRRQHGRIGLLGDLHVRVRLQRARRRRARAHHRLLVRIGRLEPRCAVQLDVARVAALRVRLRDDVRDAGEPHRRHPAAELLAPGHDLQVRAVELVGRNAAFAVEVVAAVDVAAVEAARILCLRGHGQLVAVALDGIARRDDLEPVARGDGRDGRVDRVVHRVALRHGAEHDLARVLLVRPRLVDPKLRTRPRPLQVGDVLVDVAEGVARRAAAVVAPRLVRRVDPRPERFGRAGRELRDRRRLLDDDHVPVHGREEVVKGEVERRRRGRCRRTFAVVARRRVLVADELPVLRPIRPRRRAGVEAPVDLREEALRRAVLVVLLDRAAAAAEGAVVDPLAHRAHGGREVRARLDELRAVLARRTRNALREAVADDEHAGGAVLGIGAREALRRRRRRRHVVRDERRRAVAVPDRGEVRERRRRAARARRVLDRERRRIDRHRRREGDERQVGRRRVGNIGEDQPGGETLGRRRHRDVARVKRSDPHAEVAVEPLVVEDDLARPLGQRRDRAAEAPLDLKDELLVRRTRSGVDRPLEVPRLGEDERLRLRRGRVGARLEPERARALQLVDRHRRIGRRVGTEDGEAERRAVENRHRPGDARALVRVTGRDRAAVAGQLGERDRIVRALQQDAAVPHDRQRLAGERERARRRRKPHHVAVRDDVVVFDADRMRGDDAAVLPRRPADGRTRRLRERRGASGVRADEVIRRRRGRRHVVRIGCSARRADAVDKRVVSRRRDRLRLRLAAGAGVGAHARIAARRLRRDAARAPVVLVRLRLPLLARHFPRERVVGRRREGERRIRRGHDAGRRRVFRQPPAELRRAEPRHRHREGLRRVEPEVLADARRRPDRRTAEGERAAVEPVQMLGADEWRGVAVASVGDQHEEVVAVRLARTEADALVVVGGAAQEVDVAAAGPEALQHRARRTRPGRPLQRGEVLHVRRRADVGDADAVHEVVVAQLALEDEQRAVGQRAEPRDAVALRTRGHAAGAVLPLRHGVAVHRGELEGVGRGRARELDEPDGGRFRGRRAVAVAGQGLLVAGPERQAVAGDRQRLQPEVAAGVLADDVRHRQLGNDLAGLRVVLADRVRGGRAHACSTVPSNTE